MIQPEYYILVLVKTMQYLMAVLVDKYDNTQYLYVVVLAVYKTNLFFNFMYSTFLDVPTFFKGLQA